MPRPCRLLGLSWADVDLDNGLVCARAHGPASALSHNFPTGGREDQQPRLGGRVVSSNSGADEGIRTPDPCFTKALLYP